LFSFMGEGRPWGTLLFEKHRWLRLRVGRMARLKVGVATPKARNSAAGSEEYREGMSATLLACEPRDQASNWRLGHSVPFA